jgi:hypothetical protein
MLIENQFLLSSTKKRLKKYKRKYISLKGHQIISLRGAPMSLNLAPLHEAQGLPHSCALLL